MVVRSPAVRGPVSPPPRRTLRQRLCGRYRWLVLAATAGAAVGTGVMWSTYRPAYLAEAVLAIEPARAAGVSSDRLDAIVERLIETLRSPATLQTAGSIDRNRLAIAREADPSWRIVLRYHDPEATAAGQAVGRVLDAGVAASELSEHEATIARIANWHAQIERDGVELAKYQALHRQAVDAFGMLPLDQRIADRRRELDRLVVQLREIEMTLAAAKEAQHDAESQAADAPQPQGKWAVVVRQVMAALPRPPATVAMVDLDGHPLPPMTMSQLAARKVGLESMRGIVSEELGDLIAKAATLNALQGKVSELAAAIDAQRERVDLLSGSDAAVARLWVLDRGQAAALADAPRYVAALAGGGAAGALALACLVTLALAADRRLRRVAQVAAAPHDPPVLSAVPLLDRRQQTDRLAQAVHEVRSILEIHAENHGFRAFAVTSPTRGSGKTSLTVGLGTSLAMSGSRTLMVDLDLASRVAVAPDGHQTIEQVMIEMGYVDGDSRALVKRGAPRAGRGLAGMLDGAALRQSVMPTKVARLDVLHAHGVDAARAGRLSSRFLSEVIGQARAEYDLVLIDAGPVPGSVEGMLAAARADAVIVVVQRNESQRQYDRTLAHLRLIEAHVIGSVLNRADRRDVSAAVTPSARPAAVRRRHPRPDVGAGSGILAAAVAAHSGSAFDQPPHVAARDIVPASDLQPVAIIDDDQVHLASADETGEWETELEASLDQLIDEVSQPTPARKA